MVIGAALSAVADLLGPGLFPGPFGGSVRRALRNYDAGREARVRVIRVVDGVVRPYPKHFLVVRPGRSAYVEDDFAHRFAVTSRQFRPGAARGEALVTVAASDGSTMTFQLDERASRLIGDAPA